MWNSALDQPYQDFPLELVRIKDGEVIQTIRTTLTGNISLGQRDLLKKDYKIRMVNQGGYTFLLPTEIELNNDQDNVLLWKNYREADFFFNVSNSLGVYDSVKFVEHQPNLDTTITNVYEFATLGTTTRPEGPWQYEITYYRDTIDSVVNLDMDLLRRSSQNYEEGQNELTIEL